jgi:hypothetical protein
VLTRGRITLYRYSDEKPHYFVQKEGGLVQELVVQKYLLTGNGARNVVSVEPYQDRLAQLLSDCPQLARKTRNTSFSEAALTGILREYNACTGTAVEPVKPAVKSRIRFGLKAGVSRTTLTISQRTEEVTFGHSVQPTGALYLDLPLQWKLRNWSYHGEAAYKGYKLENNVAVFDMKYVRLNNLLRYQFSKWSVQPFAQAGFSVSYAFQNDNYRKTAPNLTRTPYLPSPRKYEHGLLAGAGIQAGRFSLEGRYETANGMANGIGVNANTRTLYLLLGYQIR